jgi:hypothetical protein
VVAPEPEPEPVATPPAPEPEPEPAPVLTPPTPDELLPYDGVYVALPTPVAAASSGTAGGFPAPLLAVLAVLAIAVVFHGPMTEPTPKPAHHS